MPRLLLVRVAAISLAALTVLAACSFGDESGDVKTTSTQAEPDQFPWMASTRIPAKNLCGGVLISPTWVLTGKHCHESVLANNADHWQVRLDSVERKEGGELIDARRFVDYPGSEVDLALIELERPATTKPLALIDVGNTAPYEIGAEAITLGWGTDGISNKPTKILEWTAQITAPNDTCGGGQNGEFCGGRPNNEGSGTCTFDSGGPYVWAAKGFAADGSPLSTPYVAGTLRGLNNESCGIPGRNDDWQSTGGSYGQWIREQIE